MTLEINSDWRTLAVSDPNSNRQLLGKYTFTTEGYKIYVTDLCHFWSEHMTRQEILDRAKAEETSIDPSEDGTQFEIMFQRISAALQGAKDTQTTISEGRSQRLIIKLTVSLPQPLQPLKWAIQLTLMPKDSVKYDFIMPLLRMTLGKHEQVNELSRLIVEKDNVMAKILDKVESMGMDLSSIFPTSGVAKAGRRGNRRDIVAKHVKGLAPFDQKTWLETFSSTLNTETTFGNLIENVFAGTGLPPAANLFNAISRRASDAESNTISQDQTSQFQRQNTPPILVGLVQGNKDVTRNSTRFETPDEPCHGPVDDDETTDDDDFQQDVAPSIPVRKATPEINTRANTLNPSPMITTKVDKAQPTSTKRKLGKLGGLKKRELSSEAQLAPVITNHEHEASIDGEKNDPVTRLGGENSSADLKTERESPEYTTNKQTTPEANQQNNQKPRKLGRIGGAKPAASNDTHPTPGASMDTNHVDAEEDTKSPPSTSVKPSPRKLGRIGGRSGEASQSQMGMDDGANHASNAHHTLSIPREDEEPGPASKIEAEKSPTPPESSEQKADRKREELKRALESNSMAQQKKKRRF